jgi:hypothetical protein
MFSVAAGSVPLAASPAKEYSVADVIMSSD